MQLNIHIPTLLKKSAPILKYVAIAIPVIYLFLGGVSGFLSGLLVGALFLIISFLCDAVVELYAQIELLQSKDSSPSGET